MPKARLTDRFVKTRKPVEKGNRIAYFDTAEPGFHYRPSAVPGRGSFYVKYVSAGRQRRYKLGEYPRMSLAEARRKAAQVRDDVREGDTDPALMRHYEKGRVALAEGTFKRVFGLYIEGYAKGKQPRSWRTTENAVERLAMPSWGDREIDGIKLLEVTDLIDRVKVKNGPIMANRLHSYLAAFWTWAIGTGHAKGIDGNGLSPVNKFQRATSEEPRDRVLTEDELRRVLNRASAIPSIFGQLFPILILTGQRRQEVAGMRWSELDLDRPDPLWVIPKERYKTKREQRIPLADATVKLLLDLRASSDGHYDHVFATGRAGDSAPVGFSKVKKQLDGKSGVTDWRTHDIRRSMRSWMAENGIASEIAEKCLGHGLKGIQATYDHSTRLPEMRAAFSAWASYVTGLTEPEERSANVVAMR